MRAVLTTEVFDAWFAGLADAQAKDIKRSLELAKQL